MAQFINSTKIPPIFNIGGGRCLPHLLLFFIFLYTKLYRHLMFLLSEDVALQWHLCYVSAVHHYTHDAQSQINDQCFLCTLGKYCQSNEQMRLAKHSTIRAVSHTYLQRKPSFPAVHVGSCDQDMTIVSITSTASYKMVCLMSLSSSCWHTSSSLTYTRRAAKLTLPSPNSPT